MLFSMQGPSMLFCTQFFLTSLHLEFTFGIIIIVTFMLTHNP